MFNITDEKMSTIIALSLIVLYVLDCLAIIRLAMHTGEGKLRYLAWFPIFNIYYTVKIGLGKTCAIFVFFTEIILSSKIINITNIVIPSIVLNIISLLASLMMLIALIKIYEYYSRHPVILTILSFLSFGILVPIFLFAIRNIKKPTKKIDDINTNATTYININKQQEEINQNNNNNSEKPMINTPHVEDDGYDIRNSWDGPK